MNVEVIKYPTAEDWMLVKKCTLVTVGKETNKPPTDKFKLDILKARHSPIRELKFVFYLTDIPYWVSVHLVRHKIGIEHWVATQRTDRTGIDRNELPQGALVNHACEADAQALINISRKRLCNGASPETREAWQEVKDEVALVEPELASCMVKECIYRGFCPEMFPCGYSKTKEFERELEEYRYGKE